MHWDTFDPNGAHKRFLNCEVRMDHLGDTKKKADDLLGSRTRYGALASFVSIPWYIIGVIHQMETGGSFSRHLHNGDPLSDRTIHVPAGRPIADPASGAMPYSWEESALDALKDRPKPTQWGQGYDILFIEAYNGMAYRKHGINSPYVWSFTTAYDKGKFTSDHGFDADAVSEQVGAAAILKLLQNWKEINLA